MENKQKIRNLEPLNKEWNEHDYIKPFNPIYILFKGDIYQILKFNAKVPKVY